MAAAKTSAFVILGLVMQSFIIAQAKPSECGCGWNGGRPVGGYGGGVFGGYDTSYLGGCGGPIPAPVPPPICFAPIPQPVPIKIPVARPQSVTIPNIILALLPPKNKSPAVKPCLPPPLPRPQPIVFPLPQPYPVPVPDCGC